MSTENQLIFGEGTLVVTSTINTLIFKQLQLPLNIGDEVDPRSYQTTIINSFTIQFQNHTELQELRKLLINSYQNKLFVFKNIRFNFLNYTRKSVDCILDQLNWIEKFIPTAQII